MTTATAITLTDEQARAVDAIKGWYDRGERPYFTLGGLAGTGKSTILQHLVSDIQGTVLVASPTGKAANVLRRKGLPQAATVHSTIYTPIHEKGGKVTFVLKANIFADFMVIDEASMISKEVFADLLRLGIPILFVGDHGQLEPVGDSPNLMQNPDARLETIHRQALDSPIIAFAHELRLGLNPASIRRDLPGLRVLPRNELSSAGTINPAAQIITTFNESRVRLNALMRQVRGFTDTLHVGDRVICLRNNRELGIFNGQIFTVTELPAVDDVPNSGVIYAGLEGEDGEELLTVPMWRAQFGREKTLPYSRWDPPAVGHFDHAYAITGHKAQGSEFDDVIVFDEPGYVPWTRSRWRYTAATRAAKRLTYLV